MDIGNLSVSLEFVASGLEAGVQAAQESLEGLQDTVDRLDSTMAGSRESYTHKQDMQIKKGLFPLGIIEFLELY